VTWEEQFLPLENFLEVLNHRIARILLIEEEQKKDARTTRQEKKNTRALTLARETGFNVKHFNPTQLKLDRTLEHRKLNGASLSTTSIAHRYSTPFGECIDPSIELAAALASPVPAFANNVFASNIPVGSLLLSNLGKLPFEETLASNPRGKNKVRLPRLEKKLARLHVPMKL
jgi:hypothetical protein